MEGQVFKFALCCGFLLASCGGPPLDEGEDGRPSDGQPLGDAGGMGPDAGGPRRLGLLMANAGVSQGEPTRLYTPDGAGVYVATWVASELDLGAAVAWADYDGDGDNDFAVGNGRAPTAGLTRIYRNDGATFTTAFTGSRATITSDVRWDDFDSDGDVDLLTASGTLVVIYRNDPSGFTTVEAVDARREVTGVDVADLDGDGDSELGVATSDAVVIYTNNGGVYASRWQSNARPAALLRFGDYDNDGAPDLAYVMGDRFAVLRNNGVFGFEGALDSWNTVPRLTTQPVNAITWIDFDGDHDLDLVSAEGAWGAPATHRVYKNTAGRFSLGWESVEREWSRAVAVGDFDGDGRPDLAFGNSPEPDRIYKNTGDGFASVWASPESDRTTALTWIPL